MALSMTLWKDVLSLDSTSPSPAVDAPDIPDRSLSGARPCCYPQGSWSVLPDEVQRAVVYQVGGQRLCDTVTLKRVSRTFRCLVPDVVKRMLVEGNVEARMDALGATIAAAEVGLPGATRLLAARAAQDADEGLRKAALDALAYNVMKGDEEAMDVAAMAAQLLSDSATTVRRAALSLLKTLAERGDVVAVNGAMAVAQKAGSCMGEESAELRQDALEAVAAFVMRGDSTVVDLITHCVSDASCAVRYEAILALGEVAAPGDVEAINLLCDHLVYPDVVTRRIAAAACARIALTGDPHTVEALARCAREDVEPSVRVFALDAMAVVAKVGDSEALHAADACLTEGDVMVRRAAARASAVLKGESPSVE